MQLPGIREYRLLPILKTELSTPKFLANSYLPTGPSPVQSVFESVNKRLEKWPNQRRQQLWKGTVSNTYGNRLAMLDADAEVEADIGDVLANEIEIHVTHARVNVVKHIDPRQCCAFC